MKRSTASFLVVIVLITLPTIATAQAQQGDTTTSHQVSGAIMMSEIAAIAGVAKGDLVALIEVLPADARPAANQDLDVRQGDQILMVNGQRVRELEDLNTVYSGLAIGDEVKLGIKRGSERFILRFEKQKAQAVSSSQSGGSRMVMISAEGGDVALMHEDHVMLGVEDDSVKVTHQLASGGALEEGDVLIGLNGEALASIDDFNRIYRDIAIGGQISLTVLRGGSEFNVVINKAEMPKGMMIKR